MHDDAFPLLAEIHARTDRAVTTDAALRDAVAVLVRGAARPDRAERLVPGPGEAPALVARLAVWALRRVGPATIAAAAAALEHGTPAPATDATVCRAA